MTDPGKLEFPHSQWIDDLVRQSLAEDIGPQDVSSDLAIEPGSRAEAVIVSRRPGVIAGLPLVDLVCRQLSAGIVVDHRLQDGAAVAPAETVSRLTGPTRALLTGERTLLNFLQNLSGIATLTARYVAEVAGTRCRVLDTRKTLPGFRALAKYAVRAGGGHNHRLGLYDRIMLKDNHWAASQVALEELVRRARARHPDLAIEIEVDSLEQLERVLPLQVEWVLLDNFPPDRVAGAIARRDAMRPRCRTLLEASGNIDLSNARLYADAGADAISIGRLTHSAPALDLSCEMTPLADSNESTSP